jgi:hypothetical protein
VRDGRIVGIVSRADLVRALSVIEQIGCRGEGAVTTIGMSDGRPKEPRRLRELAAGYRDFAEGAGNPAIWEARLRTAAELEREADRLEEASELPRETESNSE